MPLAPRQTGRVVVDWPPEYRAWGRQQGLLASTAPDALVARVASVTNVAPAGGPGRGERLRIVNPPSGATYLFDPTLRAEFQTLPLRAVAEPEGRVGGRWMASPGHAERGSGAGLASGARGAHGGGQ